MADLPIERIRVGNPPFHDTGMDYFGPFEVKRGRATMKRYGVLFTCMASRAVHLEVAHSLDTTSCINAIKRFTARRGNVNSIRSDNGTNLVGAERELKQSLRKYNQQQMQMKLMKRGINWHFNPPAGSPHGGIWERIIRSVRKILYGLMKEQNVKLNDESMQTLFCEVEEILNGRPLTESPNSPNDLDVLTPNHLLRLNADPVLPVGVFTRDDTYSTRRWRQIQYLADVFWRRWVNEYFPMLQQTQKWTHPKRNLVVGDVVLVMNQGPRNMWMLGRVTEVYNDRKWLVRSVKVRTESSSLIRPVTKLCLLVECDNVNNSDS